MGEQKNDTSVREYLGALRLDTPEQIAALNALIERVVASGVLSCEQQARLQRLYEQTNPAQLRESIYRQLAALWQVATTLPTSAVPPAASSPGQSDE